MLTSLSSPKPYVSNEQPSVSTLHALCVYSGSSKALDPKPRSVGVQLERAGLIDADKDGEGIKGVEDQDMLMAIMDARELFEGTQVRAKGIMNEGTQVRA